MAPMGPFAFLGRRSAPLFSVALIPAQALLVIPADAGIQCLCFALARLFLARHPSESRDPALALSSSKTRSKKHETRAKAGLQLSLE